MKQGGVAISGKAQCNQRISRVLGSGSISRAWGHPQIVRTKKDKFGTNTTISGLLTSLKANEIQYNYT